MGADNMAKYLDFFNIYIMGVIEASFYVYFLSKFLKKKIWPPFYFLFGVGVVIAGEFIPNGTIAGFVVFVLLLSICGAFVCHANFKASLLYATLTMEIMLLCSGIVNSLMSLPYPWLPAFFHEPGNVAAMLICEAASFLLSGFCYYIEIGLFLLCPEMKITQRLQKMQFCLIQKEWRPAVKVRVRKKK